MVGIFPCRAVNSVTGSEVSLPPCPAACPRRPQLDPGGQPPHGSSLAPARQLPPCGWAGRGGGLRFLPAGLSWSCYPKRVISAMVAIYSQEGRVYWECPCCGMGGTPEAWLGSSHRCSQGAEGPDEETGSRRRGCQDLAAQTLPSPGSLEVRPARDGSTPASASHLRGRHPAPRPVRQDLSPAPWVPPRRVNPCGGPGWERGRAESVLVCQRSGYRRCYVPGSAASRFHPVATESVVAPFLARVVRGSRETLEHLAVPKGAPRELQRDLSQGHGVTGQRGTALY